MITSKFRPVICLATVNKNFVRTVAVNKTVQTENTQSLRSWKEVPGPSSLPLIGQLHHFLPGGDLSNIASTDFIELLYNKFGPLVRLQGFFGASDIYFLYDAESTAQILRSEDNMPVRPGFPSLDYYRRSKVKENEPTGLITDHGELWKQFRSTVNPVMLQPKTIKLYSGQLDEVAQDMIKRMRSIRGEDNMLKGNFDMEMNLWALESIGLVALGCRLNCFDPNLPEDSPAKKLIQLVHDMFKVANELDFKPSMWRYYPTKTFKKAMKMYEDQATVARYFVDKSIEELKVKGKTEDQKGILEKLLEINKEVALIMASDMLFAGVDTAANTITATFYLLAKNQEKQDKLREELKSDSEKRPYLRACIKESLRLMPVVAGNFRMTTKEHNVLGYLLPKGTHVSFVHQTMAIQDKHFPKPKEFLPERWIVSKDDPLYHGNAHPFANMPFGFGVRSCIGRRIAELEIETFLARAIQNFKVEWFGPPIQVTPSSLNYITGPFNFVFKDV
ncbi:hypothetical protein ABMA27_015823 [Loxostege sticticalis]|uniref:Cytochrome P450 n=1 Tax=Loxostege sticticalis TaxID=481309 RepID=A0ABR3I4F0_LOXSC